MKKTICVDVDGVLADYSKGWQGIENIGEPIPGAVEFTKRLSEFANVLIFTTRCCADKNLDRGDVDPALLVEHVREWLDRHGFAYDEIYAGQGKPHASAYIDDRAVECVPQKITADTEYNRAIRKAKELCL